MIFNLENGNIEDGGELIPSADPCLPPNCQPDLIKEIKFEIPFLTVTYLLPNPDVVHGIFLNYDEVFYISRDGATDDWEDKINNKIEGDDSSRPLFSYGVLNQELTKNSEDDLLYFSAVFDLGFCYRWGFNSSFCDVIGFGYVYRKNWGGCQIYAGWEKPKKEDILEELISIGLSKNFDFNKHLSREEYFKNLPEYQDCCEAPGIVTPLPETTTTTTTVYPWTTTTTTTTTPTTTEAPPPTTTVAPPPPDDTDPTTDEEINSPATGESPDKKTGPSYGDVIPIATGSSGGSAPFPSAYPSIVSGYSSGVPVSGASVVVGNCEYLDPTPEYIIVTIGGVKWSGKKEANEEALADNYWEGSGEVSGSFILYRNTSNYGSCEYVGGCSGTLVFTCGHFMKNPDSFSSKTITISVFKIMARMSQFGWNISFEYTHVLNSDGACTSDYEAFTETNIYKSDLGGNIDRVFWSGLEDGVEVYWCCGGPIEAERDPNFEPFVSVSIP